VCNQASLGVAAIFGPRSSSIASYINSMCNTLEVPHVEARLDARSGAGHVFSLNVHPQASQLGRVYVDMLQHFGWTKFCVVYGEHSGQSDYDDVLRVYWADWAAWLAGICQAGRLVRRPGGPPHQMLK